MENSKKWISQGANCVLKDISFIILIREHRSHIVHACKFTKTHLHTHNWGVPYKACSHYENNVHWKRINSHCLYSHWTYINCNLLSMSIQSIHFHRWFEADLKVNCIMTWNNMGVIYLCVIYCMKKQVIKEEIPNVTLLLCLGKYFICYGVCCNETCYILWPCSTINVVVPTVGCIIQFKTHAVITSHKQLK